MITSWRNVIAPHIEVAKGNYSNAEFMADLGLAAGGEGSEEYTNSAEFFRRTYLTSGLRNLLMKAVKRVCGRGGDPVIQIKTAFGGGKTHSMLALYHLMKGGVNPDNVLGDAGEKKIPHVKLAVLACTHYATAEPVEIAGMSVNTLCGIMAAQLGGYEYVREADMKSVPPGSDALRKMFDELGPCVVLIDELVAYGRTLREDKVLTAGRYSDYLTFIQQLTEAVRMSSNSLVAVTLPESELEAGNEHGRKVLNETEHIFERSESVWQPVEAREGFEIVRRRLFSDEINTAERDRTADAFCRMYRENSGDFPVETKEAAYRERIISCYPVHPEVFDRLYADWATLPKFQRTRGVLKLMAAVIHELWVNNDASALIMPGSFPLYSGNVREKLIVALPDGEGWRGVIDSEIDGKDSKSLRVDAKNRRFGIFSAARKTARTIMLGSAPASREGSLRGLEKERVLLGSVQPEDNISGFSDALNELKNELNYIYTDGSQNNGSDVRFWFDTRPTLRKLAAERAGQFSSKDVDDEIKRRLKVLLKNFKPFSGAHLCPETSRDVSDVQSLRLVVLGPECVYGINAQNKAMDILMNHGDNQRTNRNMLVFLAADGLALEGLRGSVRRYLSWKSIELDYEKLRLDSGQIREAKESVSRCDTEAQNGVISAWCWGMAAKTEQKGRVDAVSWDNVKLGSSENIADAAAEALKNVEGFVKHWDISHLMLEFEWRLWKDGDELSVQTLWNEICTYCYYPKIVGYEVLETVIRDGVSEGKIALAEGKADGKYTGLKFNKTVSSVNMSAYLVKPEAAKRQLEESKPESKPEMPELPKRTPEPVPAEHKKKVTAFHLPAKMDIATLKRDSGKLADEVIANLAGLGRFEITLEIHFYADDEIPEDIARVIAANCKDLRYKNYNFEEE